MTVLASARNKLDRANKHIADVERDLQVSMQNGPYRLEYEGRYSDVGLALICATNPVEINFDGTMLIVGDAIHNLRSALDHCVWGATNWSVGLTEEEVRELEFPTYRGIQKSKYRKKFKQKAAISPDTKLLLTNLEAFEGGTGQDILDLHLLDVTDKHCTMIPVYSGIILSGLKRQGYDENGRQILTPEKDHNIDPYNSSDKMYHTMQGSYYSFTLIERWNTKEHRGLDFSEARVRTRLSFSQANRFAGSDIHSTLLKLSARVKGIITAFQNMIDARP